MRAELYCPTGLSSTKPYPIPTEPYQTRCPCSKIWPLVCRLPVPHGDLSHKEEARGRNDGGGSRERHGLAEGSPKAWQAPRSEGTGTGQWPPPQVRALPVPAPLLRSKSQSEGAREAPAQI